MRFTWDPKKAASNVRDHDGVTFDEARTVFDDPNVSIDRDLTHLDRAIAIGFSAVPRLLYVVSIELEDEPRMTPPMT